MSVGTEVCYARQAGINHACLVVISNPAEGLGA
jgi:5'-methylthioadenosine phosphorylase